MVPTPFRYPSKGLCGGRAAFRTVVLPIPASPSSNRTRGMSVRGLEERCDRLELAVAPDRNHASS